MGTMPTLPEPQPYDPVILDGSPTPIMGWLHHGFFYAFTVRPTTSGRYLAVIVNFATREAMAIWPCETLLEAKWTAGREFQSDVEHPRRDGTALPPTTQRSIP